MNRTGKHVLALLVVCLTAAVSSQAIEAFKFVGIGDELPVRELERHGGEPCSYLGDDGYEARFFAFVKEDRASSLALLDTINVLQQDFAERSVNWTLILSGRSSAGWPDTVAAHCPEAVVLIDEGDELYGTLGVPLTPVVGIGDEDRRLSAYLTYRKINFRPVIAAHLKFVLGDISQEELERSLRPSGRARDTASASAHRKMKLARLLLAKQKNELGLKQAESAVEEAPELPETWQLLAEARAAVGDEAGAQEARDQAAALAETNDEPGAGAPDEAAAPAAADTTAGTGALPDDGSDGTDGDGD